MPILFDSIPILEVLYDLDMSRQSVAEEMVTINHNHRKTNDVEILTEGARELINTIISGLKKFLQKIKELISKHLMILNSYHLEYNKLIEKYSKVLINCEVKPFEIEGFNFTVLSNPRPDTSEVYRIIDEFNSDIVKFSSLTIEDVRELKLKKSSDLTFDRLRGIVLGSNSRIYPEDFKRTAHCFYRNGMEFPHNITIDRSYVDIVLKNSGALVAEKKASTMDKDVMLATLSRLERFFSTKVSSLYDDVERVYNVANLQKNGETAENAQKIEEKEMTKLIMYLGTRYQQTVELSNIISMVFVERLAAIKDQMNQDTQVIRTVLRHANPSLLEGTMAMMEGANSYPPTPNTNWAPIWEGVSVYGGEE